MLHMGYDLYRKFNSKVLILCYFMKKLIFNFKVNLYILQISYPGDLWRVGSNDNDMQITKIPYDGIFKKLWLW